MSELDKGTNQEDPATEESQVDLVQSVEHYLPTGFPAYLFQGTSTSNSDTVREIGLRGGSLITDVGGCMDSRFYRGRFLISKYDTSIFEPELENYIQYAIREGTANNEEAKRVFSYDAMDTDSVERRMEMTSSRLNDRENLASFDLSISQRIYIQMIARLIRGGLCGETNPSISAAMEQVGINIAWDQMDKPFPSDSELMDIGKGSIERGEKMFLEYSNYYPLRQEIARVLGIDISAFASPEDLRKVLNNLGEDVVMDKLTQCFPGEVVVDWNNLGIDQQTLKRKMIEQVYMTHVVRLVKHVYGQGTEKMPGLIYVKGESSRGLEALVELKKPKANISG